MEKEKTIDSWREDPQFQERVKKLKIEFYFYSGFTAVSVFFQEFTSLAFYSHLYYERMKNELLTQSEQSVVPSNFLKIPLKYALSLTGLSKVEEYSKLKMSESLRKQFLHSFLNHCITFPVELFLQKLILDREGIKKSLEFVGTSLIQKKENKLGFGVNKNIVASFFLSYFGKMTYFGLKKGFFALTKKYLGLEKPPEVPTLTVLLEMVGFKKTNKEGTIGITPKETKIIEKQPTYEEILVPMGHKTGVELVSSILSRPFRILSLNLRNFNQIKHLNMKFSLSTTRHLFFGGITTDMKLIIGNLVFGFLWLVPIAFLNRTLKKMSQLVYEESGFPETTKEDPNSEEETPKVQEETPETEETKETEETQTEEEEKEDNLGTEQEEEGELDSEEENDEEDDVIYG